ncbi:MAG: ATP-binding protein [Gallionellaceae bacterium]|nr:ATP-binding protein [Gallionellaceae bacterium]
MPSSLPFFSFQARAYSAPSASDLWRSVTYFNYYRLTLGLLFVALANWFGSTLSLGSSNLSLFLRVSIVYIVLVLASQAAIQLRRPSPGWQLGMQMGADIACITLLSHASGGIQSNLGLLLLVSLAAAGLISRGKITLFFAALASLASLLQQTYSMLTQESTEAAQFFQAGLLCMAYFAVAWLAHTFAKYAVASEKLATLRGIDLANMAEANQLVIQDMPDGVLVVDEQGVVRQHNRSAERMLGYPFPQEGNIVLNDCSPLLAGQFAAWRQGLGYGSEVLRLPVTNSLIRIRFQPIQREGSGGAVLFLEDMRRVQAQAQQIKLAALGRLTANIAHEVRNPLSSISYATELLREEKHDSSQARLFQIIVDNIARLNQIVQDVMQLNQRDRAQREVLHLDERLLHFVDELRHAENVPREVFLVEAATDCVVDFDRAHLERILWNLCRNALRYCSKRADSVQLCAWRSKQGRVVLEIRNDGPPVAPENIQQLFEPFFTTSIGGTGLGLYIARELCEANGAALEYSQRPESGACFRIVFGEKK